MNAFEFVEGLATGGMPFADTEDEDYCPEHGWDTDAYHHEWCEIYATKLGLS